MGGNTAFHIKETNTCWEQLKIVNNYDDLFEQMDIIRKMHENFGEFVKAGYGDETLEKLEMCSRKDRSDGESEYCVRRLRKK